MDVRGSVPEEQKFSRRHRVQTCSQAHEASHSKSTGVSSRWDAAEV